MINGMEGCPDPQGRLQVTIYYSYNLCIIQGQIPDFGGSQLRPSKMACASHIPKVSLIHM